MKSPNPTKLALRDLWQEAQASLLTRPMRSALTALGTIIGVAALVAILGLSETAAGQVSDRFDALAATTVTATDNRTPQDPAAIFPFTRHAIARAGALNGVEGAGAMYTVLTDDHVRGPNPAQPHPVSLPIVAATPTIWDAVEPTVAAGRTFDAALAATPVCVLGTAAAQQLGIKGLAAPTAVEIGGHPYTVIGVLTDVTRRPELRASVIIPFDAAIATWGEPDVAAQTELVIATDQGAAQQVAQEVRWALAPAPPESIKVEEPPDPRTLRNSISRDLSSMFLSLGAVALLIGAFGIANSTLVSVMERRGEFGLRRALGATRADIMAQVTLESALLGIIGGLAGATLGLYAVIAAALWLGWSPILNPIYLIIAPIVGLATGVAAGAHPARRAGRIGPAEALRST